MFTARTTILRRPKETTILTTKTTRFFSGSQSKDPRVHGQTNKHTKQTNLPTATITNACPSLSYASLREFPPPPHTHTPLPARALSCPIEIRGLPAIIKTRGLSANQNRAFRQRGRKTKMVFFSPTRPMTKKTKGVFFFIIGEPPAEVPSSPLHPHSHPRHPAAAAAADGPSVAVVAAAPTAARISSPARCFPSPVSFRS